MSTRTLLVLVLSSALTFPAITTRAADSVSSPSSPGTGTKSAKSVPSDKSSTSDKPALPDKTAPSHKAALSNKAALSHKPAVPDKTATSDKSAPSHKPNSPDKTSDQPDQKAQPAKESHKPEIGAISRSTGHLFREGLAAGIAADRVGASTHKSETTANAQGLLDSKKVGSLGDKIWQGMAPDDFTRMIEALEPNTQIPTLDPLARRLLLTDSPWPNASTGDMRALRLEKMLAFGAANEAAHLYAFWSPTAPGTRLARAGVEAMYRTGQTATACLEMNANTDIPVAGNPFWDKAVEACKTLKFDGQDLTSLSETRPARAFAALPEDARAPAIALYAEQSANLLKDVPGRTTRILQLFPKMPWSTRVLFMPTFMNLPDDFKANPKETRMILGTLLAGGSRESSRWAKQLRASLPAPLASDGEAAALLLLAQMRGMDDPKGQIPFKFEGIDDATGHHQAKLFIKLTELLDTRPNFIDNPPVTYEKKGDLTQAVHYVIPEDVLQSYLSKPTQNGAQGPVLLASLLTLQSKDIGAINPDLFADVIQDLMSAGLNEEARQAVTYVFLGASQLGE